MTKTIIVCGMQRSGTTLMASMLGKLKNVVALPEMPFILDLIIDYELKLETEIVERRLKSHPRYIMLGDNFKSFELSSTFNETLVKFLQLYKSEYNIDEKSDIYILQCPEDMKNLDILCRSFDVMGIVLMYRDPRAVYSSYLSSKWGPPTIFDFCAYWRETVGTIYFLKHKLKAAIVFKYEQFSDENYFVALINFLNLKKQDNYISDTLRLPEFTKKQHRLVYEKFDASRNNLWRKKLSSFQVKIIENHCGVLFRLNYLPTDKIGVQNKILENVYLGVCYIFAPVIRMGRLLKRKFITRIDRR